MLLIICIIAIGALIMNIKVIQKNSYIGIRMICTILWIGSIMRYITLLIFARAISMEILIKMQDFYFLSLIGITIPSLLLLWYITPFYREKVSSALMAIFCTPWIIFYTVLLILKPYQVIKSQTMGYTLRLTGNWPLYLTGLQGSFVLVFILAALYGYKLYKHQQTRSQYMILIMCQLLFLMDGLTYFSLMMPIIPVFTLTEALGFLALYYGYSKPPIDTRGLIKR